MTDLDSPTTGKDAVAARRRRILRGLFLGVPVLLWAVALFYGGAEGARYETSWWWTQWVLRLLCPEHAPPGDGSVLQVDVSMYQLNGALRRVAHIAGYAILSALVVRFFQRGEPRLKRSAVVAALVLGILYTGFDEFHRLLEPNRHAKWIDLYLNLFGVLLTILVTVLYFSLKAWERRLFGNTSVCNQGKIADT